MPNYWIVKTEPSTYSYDDLARQKAAVGVAEVTSEAYPDPKQQDPKLAVVDLRAVERLPRAVPLAEIKKDRAFADLALVRIGRLSVMLASADQFKRILKLGGVK